MDQRAVPFGYVRYGETYPPELRYLYQPPPLPRRRHTRLYALLAILGVLVIVALAVDIPFVRPILQQYPATLRTPDSVVGLPRLNSSQLQGLSDRLRAGVGHGGDALVAFYGPVDTPGNGVAVVARTGFNAHPGSLTRWLASAGVRDVAQVNPGTMGGYVACGQADAMMGPVATCAWSDYGSLGVVAGANRSTDDTAALLRTIRPLILHRP